MSSDVVDVGDGVRVGIFCGIIVCVVCGIVVWVNVVCVNESIAVIVDSFYRPPQSLRVRLWWTEERKTT